MNSAAQAILDSSLQWSLIVFLVTFISFFLYAWNFLRQQEEELLDYFEEENEERFADAPGLDDEEDYEPYVPGFNTYRPLWHSLILAGVAGGLAFLVLCFAPLPFLDNFATHADWKTTPLRLGNITYDRFHEGFSISGEIWNQTRDPIENLKAVVTVLDQNDEPLDELVLDVAPASLEAGAAGEFSTRYARQSGLLRGYRIEFRDPEGARIPHQAGFDAQ